MRFRQHFQMKRKIQMTFDRDGILDLENLEVGLEGAVGTTDRLNARLGDMDRSISKMTHGIDRGLKQAIAGLAFEGDKLSTVLNGLAQSVVRSSYNAAISPVTKTISGAIAEGIEGFTQSAMGFGKGGAFSQGRVIPFAKGGVVNGPTNFAMRGATGLMGEAGPEAIMPLSRGADGSLGVKAAGGGRPINVTINVTSPDVDGFRRSQTQIAASMSRVLARAGRNQ